MRRSPNYIISLFAVICIVRSQHVLTIADYQPFPSEISILNINPDSFEWGVAGSFLLLDKIDNQLVSVGNLNGFQTVGGFGRNNFSFSEPIWVGVEPNGISILDRLENKIVYLDYRLNYMSEVNLEPRLYPDLAAIDKWGKMFIYSSQFHSIFHFEKRHLRKTPHIDLNRFSNIDFCIRKLMVNQDGELGILDCNSYVHLFSKHGELKRTIKSHIDSPEFLVPIRDKWYVFNKEGNGQSIIEKITLQIPAVSLPIKDIKSMNRSLAILSNDHISILNVKLK